VLAAVLASAHGAALEAAPAAAAVDHSAFDSLLRAHVTHGLVDYDAFARSSGFRTYLTTLERARLEGRGDRERLAFWINAYNAWTIEQVNRNGERHSIRNIRPARASHGDAWSERIVRAAGRALTLDEVEHQVIRKEFAEPRVHFALVCAALSCPPLRSEAYTGDRLEEQLDGQARTFLLGSPEKNRVDAASGTVWVSPVFVWFREDFGGTDEAVGRYVARYWPDGPERRLLRSGRFRMRQTEYDWTLNSVEKGRAPRGAPPPRDSRLTPAVPDSLT
jgi:hypothetical protein